MSRRMQHASPAAIAEALGEATGGRAGGAWRIVERGDCPARRASLESVLAVGNGFLGLRGTPEEGFPAHDPGAIVNGFHETWPIVYPEDAFGLARTGQTIVPCPDGSIIRLTADGDAFDLGSAELLHHERALDMRRGVLTREVRFLTRLGRRVVVRSTRLASLADPHLAAMRFEVHAPDGAEIEIASELRTPAPAAGSDDPRRGKGFAERPLVPGRACCAGARAVLELTTRDSGLRLACAMDHKVTGAERLTAEAEGDGARVVFGATLAPGGIVRLEKLVAYHWGDAAREDLATRAEGTLDRAARAGYDRVERAHRRRVNAFWRRSDVVIEGAPEIQKAVRFNLFSLLQATPRLNGLGQPAKGVTGRGYEGHYFWDTEIYVVPFLIHTDPAAARRVLEFRCGKLDAARERAREVGHGGALFPWRTIDGREASAWYASGTAQYHINADVAYALRHYLWVTGDLEFVLGRGAEVLIETARFWMELGFFSERRGGRFCLTGVTGPDEYTTVVDNNAYTNLMARENLEGAARVVDWLAGQDRDAHAALLRRTGVTDEEVAGWRSAAEHMYVPRHEQLGIVLQDEHFLDRPRWDFEGTPPERYPLLLHHHPLELYRHQVIKQTDVVLATYLLDRSFSGEEIRRTFDYYDPLTTGDSTLSACVQSIVASAAEHPEAALRYFLDACSIDLLDSHGNAGDGLHIAACGGTWLALVAGFGGLRDFDGEVRFDPRLPEGWERLRFAVEVRGQRLEVDMTPGLTTYTLLDGPGLLVEHRGELLRVAPGAPVVMPDETEELPLAA